MSSQPHHDPFTGSAAPAPPGSEASAKAADRAALDTALTVSLALVAGRVLLGPRAGLLAAAALTGARLWKQHAGKRAPAAPPAPVPAPVSVQEPPATPDLAGVPPSAAPARSVSLEGAPSLLIAPVPAFASPPPPSVEETAPQSSATWSFDRPPGAASPDAPVTLPGSPATVFSAFSSAPLPASPVPAADPTPESGRADLPHTEPETPPASVSIAPPAHPAVAITPAESPAGEGSPEADTAPPPSGLPDRFRRPPPPPASADAAPNDADILLEPSREATAPDSPPAPPSSSAAAPPARPRAPGRYWALVFLLLAGGAATMLALDKDKLFPPGGSDTLIPAEKPAGGPAAPPAASRDLPPANPQEAARAALDSFLAADSVEALLPIAQDPDFLRETTGLYPPEALRPLTPRAVEFEASREIPDGTATAHLFRVVTDSMPRGFPVAVEQRGADFRINWEAYAQCRDGALERFLTDPASPARGRFLVALRREIQPPGRGVPGVTPVEYHGCRLLPLTPGGSPCDAVVPVDSPLGRILSAQTEPVKTYAPVAELTREGGRVVVTRLIRETWRAGSD